MRFDLQLLCEHQEHGRELARSIFIRERLIARAAEPDRMAPDEFDLNPHLQVVGVADLVVADVREEGFDECTREEVYLLWLTNEIFGPSIGVSQTATLIGHIEMVIPYVTATLGTGNTFAIHKMDGYGDPSEWRAVHAGRAGSSGRQLKGLLEKARKMKHRASVPRPTPTERPDLYECSECSGKPGSPMLCARCLAARKAAGSNWIGPRP